MTEGQTLGSQAAYYEFMGHDSDVLRRRYAGYAKRFPPGSRVLDVGCGRGEFMELAAAAGAIPVGLDADADMVTAARAAGHEAVQAEALEYLSARSGDFDGIFCAHVVEHLPPAEVVKLVRTAAGALRPGGRLLLVTPNPHSIYMQMYEFWTDLQHVRFYTPEILRWILHEAGLTMLESGDNPDYPCGPEVPQARHVDVPDPAPREAPPVPELSTRARLRQRTAEYLQPASTLERIQAVEDRARSDEDRLSRVADGVRELQQWSDAIRTFVAQMYPPGEFYVTGVRDLAD